MQKINENQLEPSEYEIKSVFYGHVHGAEMNVSKGYYNSMISEMRAPNNSDNCILNQPSDDSLHQYSILGVEALDVYSNDKERKDYKRAIRSMNHKYW